MEIIKILFSGLIGNIIGVFGAGIISFLLLKKELQEDNKRKFMPLLDVVSIVKVENNDLNQKGNYEFFGLAKMFDYNKKSERMNIRFKLKNSGYGNLTNGKMYIFTYVKNNPVVNNMFIYKKDLISLYNFEINKYETITISKIPYYPHICHYYIFRYNDIFGNVYMKIVNYDGENFSCLNKDKMKRFKIDYIRKDESNPNKKIVEKDYFKDLEKSLKKACKDILKGKYDKPFTNSDVLDNAS